VQLKKAGREYKACCPFHSEKTPSFWVSPAKQFYHCFGCGVHGTALGFLMSYDRLSFPEAIEELATRLGVEVPREAQDPGRRSVGESHYDLMARVARHYAEQLARDERARAYVAKRGLARETVEKFQIGYAPDAWSEILRRFGADEERRRLLAETGLIIERDRAQPQAAERYYDRFRDRLMFPIRDARGRVIAFGGRVIDQGEPKYLNSPETPLFQKGRELYALYETRQTRQTLKRLLVVEGYMDAVRLHQSGIGYAVATLGTATTPEHLKRAFRLVSEVVFAFDGDRAGRAAAWRALQNALPEAREGREIRFLFLPEGHDPDSLVGEEGREAFERRIEGAIPLSEYLARELGEQVDLKHADGRARFAELARPLVQRIPEGVFRDLLTARLGEVVKLSAERLQALWSGGATLPAAGRPGGNMTHARGGSRGSARTGASAGRGGLIRQAVRTLLHFPSTASLVRPEQVAALSQVDEPGADILRRLLEGLRAEPAQTTAQVLERWRDQPEHDRLARLAVTEVLLVADARAAGRELEQALDKLIQDATDGRRIDELLAKGDSGLDVAEKQELQQLMSRHAGGQPGAASR
jgi:DNA primase